MELVENMESPRLIKTHLSFDMLPTSITQNKAKVSKIQTFFRIFRSCENGPNLLFS